MTRKVLILTIVVASFLFIARSCITFLNNTNPSDIFLNRTIESPFADVPIDRLYNILGKPYESPEVQKLFSLFTKQPDIATFEDRTFYTYHEDGIGFQIRNDVIKTVFLYRKGANGHFEYQGQLPHEIQWTDTRKDIERKFGKPDDISGCKCPFMAYYDAYQFIIEYDKKTPDGDAAEIFTIKLYIP
jgi:hypothetical protein